MIKYFLKVLLSHDTYSINLIICQKLEATLQSLSVKHGYTWLYSITTPIVVSCIWVPNLELLQQTKGVAMC